MSQRPPPPGWYPEQGSPTGIRFWDGAQWTAHVNPPPQPPAPTGPPAATAHAATTGPEPAEAPPWQSAAMLTTLKVHLEQQGRVIESSSVYALSDPEGVPLGQAVQVGQGRGARVLKAASNLDRNMPVTVEFRDPSGSLVLTLTKPGGVGPQHFVITDPTGAEIGQINQRIRVVREAFELVVAGQPAGVLSSENWYDYRFLVLDAEGAAYAQVNKVYEGYARARFTSADRYTVRYAVKTSPVQRAMALTAAIAMDIALYQH